MKPRLPAPARRRLLLLAAALAGACNAGAEANPYYIGVAETASHDSNLYRLQSGSSLPAGVGSLSDTVVSTALVGGIDQTWGRQRVNGNASLRDNRFSHNDYLNNSSYGLTLGLDWATVDRLSGSLNVDANRSLRKFDPSETSAGQLEKNIQTNRLVSGTARLGVVTALTAEASLNHHTMDYSLQRYHGAEYRQTGGGLALRYRVSGGLSVGAGLRSTRSHYNSDDYSNDRRDFDLSANWTPSGPSSLSARISHSRTSYDQRSNRDFSGLTGALSGTWQPTSKLRTTLRISRDQGLDSSAYSLQDAVISSSDLSRITTTARLGLDYAASAKIVLNGGVSRAHRNLSDALYNIVTGSSSAAGSDDTTLWSLGARWTPLRWLQVGCDLSRDQRSADSALSLPYRSNTVSCYGQAVLQ